MTATACSTRTSMVNGASGMDDSPEPGSSTMTNSYSAGISARTRSHAVRFMVVPGKSSIGVPDPSTA
jgi:hypothetical protein